MSKTKSSAKIARWALLIEEFDVTVEHRVSTRMRHVDSLSCYPIMAISSEDNILIKIKNTQRNDPELRAIIEVLKEKPYDDYILHKDVLYKYKDGRELLVIPRDMQNEFLHLLKKGDTSLHTYHLDHLGPLDSTNKNYNHILAVVDSFTKFIWLYPTESTTSKKVITKLQLQGQVFGNPSCIITDRGTAFSSAEFENYCTEQGIKHAMITTGLPRANGQVERVNRTIIPILTKLSLNDPMI
ncbi:Pro-Pol polyprotein [Cyphomyrmex costatus]|uniref:Pro-Pol polyprotein n=1 Tax=Cyphomyrmex costatus TaxID=456900 RepID=A0A151IA80_9HYME|nr:Pro-Pol polyprotein [Cyphomyrmex costatus]